MCANHATTTADTKAALLRGIGAGAAVVSVIALALALGMHASPALTKAFFLMTAVLIAGVLWQIVPAPREAGEPASTPW